MKLVHWLFATLLLQLLLLAIFLFAEFDFSMHSPHPSLKTMLHSQSAVYESMQLKWLSFLFGVLSVCILSLLLAFSFRRELLVQHAALRYRLLILGLGYGLVFSSMVVGYWFYESAGSEFKILGFPLPTFIMLLGVAPVPLVFTFFYYRYFDRWIFPPEHQEKFHELMKSNMNRRED